MADTESSTPILDALSSRVHPDDLASFLGQNSTSVDPDAVSQEQIDQAKSQSDVMSPPVPISDIKREELLGTAPEVPNAIPGAPDRVPAYSDKPLGPFDDVSEIDQDGKKVYLQGGILKDRHPAMEAFDDAYNKNLNSLSENAQPSSEDLKNIFKTSIYQITGGDKDKAQILKEQMNNHLGGATGNWSSEKEPTREIASSGEANESEKEQPKSTEDSVQNAPDMQQEPQQAQPQAQIQQGTTDNLSPMEMMMQDLASRRQGDQAQLAQAQQNYNKQVLYNQLGAAAQKVGGAVAAAGGGGWIKPAEPNTEWSQQGIAAAGQQLKNFQELQAKQMDDPTSAVSKQYVNVLRQMNPNINIPEGTLSANDVDKFSKSLTSLQENKARMTIAQAQRDQANYYKQMQLQNTEERDAGRQFSQNIESKYVQPLVSAEKVEGLLNAPNIVMDQSTKNILTNDVAALTAPVGTRAGAGAQHSQQIESAQGSLQNIINYVKSAPDGSVLPQAYKNQLANITSLMKDEFAKGMVTSSEGMKAGFKNNPTKSDFIDNRAREILQQHGLNYDDYIRGASRNPNQVQQPISAQQGPNTLKGTISQDTLNDYAEKHKISPQQASVLLQKAGYGIQ